MTPERDDEETRAERVERYVRDYSARDIAAMCVEIEEARPSRVLPRMRRDLAAAKAEVARLLAALDAERARTREVAERVALDALGLDVPYPVLSCLEQLAEAAEHLLGDHGCDKLGHEGVKDCAKAAREHVARLTGYGMTLVNRHCPESAEQRAVRETRERVIAVAARLIQRDISGDEVDLRELWRADADRRQAEAALAKAGR